MGAAMRAARATLRRSAIRRALLAYAMFAIAEKAAWGALLVYAFRAGGAQEAGLVTVAILIPALIFAPYGATHIDRLRPELVMRIALTLQGSALVAAAAVIVADWPTWSVYALFAVMPTLATLMRPAVAAELPSGCHSASELAAADAMLSWIRPAAVLVAGMWLWAWLTMGPAAAIGASAALMVVGTIASALIPDSLAGPAHEHESTFRSFVEVAHALPRTPLAGWMIILISAQALVHSGFDVLAVIEAVEVLDRSDSWVGIFGIAYGVGGVVAAMLGILLAGHRLGGVLLISSAAAGIPIIVLWQVDLVPTVLGLIALVGAGNSMVTLTAYLLLRRRVPTGLINRVLGVVESGRMLGLIIGAGLVAVLRESAGLSAPFLVVGAVLPVLVLLALRSVVKADATAAIPVVEIRALRAVEAFAVLPSHSLEALARRAVTLRKHAGDRIVAEGEVGHSYYVIVAGKVEVTGGGKLYRHMGPGEGFGEIAVLHDQPRTATITAVESTTLLEIDRDSFLEALGSNKQLRKKVKATAKRYLKSS